MCVLDTYSWTDLSNFYDKVEGVPVCYLLLYLTIVGLKLVDDVTHTNCLFQCTM